MLNGKHFADVEEVKTKNGRDMKRRRNLWVQKPFWVVKKISIDMLYQMERTLKVTEI